MNPARAMGLFLRTWRAEWARLSRAQLAIAIAARCPRRSRITAAIVRQWENGQPPQSSEELTALLEVMARHGLVPEEVAQFRQAVYKACAGHFYPELLDGDDLAFRDDIDEVAHRVCRGLMAVRYRPDTVGLVAATQELDRALTSRGGAPASATQRRRQQVALVCLRGALISTRGEPWSPRLRHPEVPAMLQANIDFIDAYFGPRGPSKALSVLRHRIVAAFAQAHAARDRRGALRLLELSEEARWLGDPEQAAEAYLMAVHCLGEMREGAYEALAPRGYECAEFLNSRCSGGVDDARMGLVWAALGDGVHDEVERLLAAVEPCSRRSAWLRSQWSNAAGHLALRRGHFGDARRHFSECRDAARLLALCDQAEEMAPRVARRALSAGAR